jgi:hypothetical protein
MSLLATRIQALRSNAPADKWETRASRYGALDLFINQTTQAGSFITPELEEKAIKAAGSQLQIPVINYDSGVQVQNTTFPLLMPRGENESAMMNVTFIDYFFGFKIYPAAHFNNEISMQRDFEAKYLKHVYKLLSMMEEDAQAALELAKTQVLTDDLGGRYPFTGDTVQVPDAEKDSFVGDMGILMGGNDHFSGIDVVGNSSFESLVRNRLMEKGQFNTEDKTYQWIDKNYHFSNFLSNPAGGKATAFAVANASVGLLEQFDPHCVLGLGSHKGQFGIDTMPILNMRMGTLEGDDQVDGTGLHGAATSRLTNAVEESYGFHKSVAYLTAYNSAPATRPSSIMKYSLNAPV